ncbi:MAG: metallophosphoesterase [Pseudomonadota bacterium]
MLTRRTFLTRLALGPPSAAIFGGGAYAGWIEPALSLHIARWRLAPMGWAGGPPLRIVALADPHCAEPWMPLSRLAAVVAVANRLRPDLVVLLGDYRASHRFVAGDVPLAGIAACLVRLRAPLGVHAILGNHDWVDDPAAMRRGGGPTETHRAFAAAGLPLLQNAAVRLTWRGQPFWLAGLGDQIAFGGMDDLDATMRALGDGAPALLLAHEPDIFARVPDRFALTLAGHTHGGQVAILGHRPVVPSAYGERYAWGHVREGGRDLVVSGGLGCSILPVRLGVPPEITLIELSSPL